MAYYKLSLLTKILDTSGQKLTNKYSKSTISEFYGNNISEDMYRHEKGRLHAVEDIPFAETVFTKTYTYNEKLVLHQQGQKELTFSLDKKLFDDDTWRENPFASKIKAGTQLLLEDKYSNLMLFTVKKVGYTITENNIVYGFTCGDSFSYQLAKENNGYTITNDPNSKNFIGAMNIDDWANKIVSECKIAYKYLPLGAPLYLCSDLTAVTTNAVSQKNIIKRLKEPYAKTEENKDLYETFPFSCSSTTSNGALIALGEQLGLSLNTATVLGDSADDGNSIITLITYFWFEPAKKDLVDGLQYSPFRNIKTFNLSQSADSLVTIMNINGQTLSSGEIVSAIPTIPPFFLRLFRSKYWKNYTQYYKGMYTKLLYGPQYELDKNDDYTVILPQAGQHTLSFSSEISDSLFYLYQLYDLQTFRSGKIDSSVSYHDRNNVLCTLDPSNSTFEASFDETGATKKIVISITNPNITNIDIPAENNISTFGLNVFFKTDFDDDDVDFAEIADKIPWLENKLIDFSYFSKNGILSPIQMNDLNNRVYTTLRKINSEILITAATYYSRLKTQTTYLSEMTNGIDTVGAELSTIVTQYREKGCEQKISGENLLMRWNFLQHSIAGSDSSKQNESSLFMDLYETTSNYMEKFLNARQRCLKNLYNFKKYFLQPVESTYLEAYKVTMTISDTSGVANLYGFEPTNKDSYAILTQSYANNQPDFFYKGGDNLLPITDVSERTINGVTFYVSNGTFYLSGTSTSGSWHKVPNYTFTLEPGVYTAYFYNNYTASPQQVSIGVWNNAHDNFYFPNSGMYRTITVTSTETFSLILWWQISDMTFDNTWAKVMICKGPYTGPKDYESFTITDYNEVFQLHYNDPNHTKFDKHNHLLTADRIDDIGPLHFYTDEIYKNTNSDSFDKDAQYYQQVYFIDKRYVYGRFSDLDAFENYTDSDYQIKIDLGDCPCYVTTWDKNSEYLKITKMIEIDTEVGDDFVMRADSKIRVSGLGSAVTVTSHVISTDSLIDGQYLGPDGYIFVEEDFYAIISQDNILKSYLYKNKLSDLRILKTYTEKPFGGNSGLLSQISLTSQQNYITLAQASTNQVDYNSENNKIGWGQYFSNPLTEGWFWGCAALSVFTCTGIPSIIYSFVHDNSPATYLLAGDFATTPYSVIRTEQGLSGYVTDASAYHSQYIEDFPLDAFYWSGKKYSLVTKDNYTNFFTRVNDGDFKLSTSYGLAENGTYLSANGFEATSSQKSLRPTFLGGYPKELFYRPTDEDIDESNYAQTTSTFDKLLKYYALTLGNAVWKKSQFTADVKYRVTKTYKKISAAADIQLNATYLMVEKSKLNKTITDDLDQYINYDIINAGTLINGRVAMSKISDTNYYFFQVIDGIIANLSSGTRDSIIDAFYNSLVDVWGNRLNDINDYATEQGIVNGLYIIRERSRFTPESINYNLLDHLYDNTYELYNEQEERVFTINQIFNNLTYKKPQSYTFTTFSLDSKIPVRMYRYNEGSVLPYIFNYDLDLSSTNTEDVLALPDAQASAVGVTARVVNGKITLSGTATSDAPLFINGISIPSGDYCMYVFNNFATTSGFYVGLRYNGGSSVNLTYCECKNKNDIVPFTIGTNAATTFVIRVKNGQNYDGFTLSPVVVRSNSIQGYAPYDDLFYKVSIAKDSGITLPSNPTNGDFWYAYANRTTTEQNLIPFYEHSALIESTLQQYWNEAYSSGLLCDICVPPEWRIREDRNINYFDVVQLNETTGHVELNPVFVPDVTKGIENRYTIMWRGAIPIVENSEIIPYSELSVAVQSEVDDMMKFCDTSVSVENLYFSKIADSVCYYSQKSGGQSWQDFITTATGVTVNGYGGWNGTAISYLTSRFLDAGVTEYEKLLQQRDDVWRDLFEEYPFLFLEGNYTDASSTTSKELVQMAIYAFEDQKYPEKSYSISLIDLVKDVESLDTEDSTFNQTYYSGPEIRIGQGIKISTEDYTKDKDDVYEALSQLLFITDITRSLRDDGDCQLTVNTIKYQDKLIRRLAKLIRNNPLN